jgi:hypothetical protein
MLLQKKGTAVNKITGRPFFMKAFTHMVIAIYMDMLKYTITCINNSLHHEPNRFLAIRCNTGNE